MPNERETVARGVYAFVNSLGIEIWFDREALIAGQDWDREIAKAQDKADLTLLVCSAEVVNRRGVIQSEIRRALRHCEEFPLGSVCLIPIRVEEIALPDELSRYQWINYFRDDWQFQLARSLELAFTQAGLDPPIALTEFLRIQAIQKQISLQSIKALSERFERELNYFVFQKDGPFWRFVNSEMESIAIGGFLKSQFDAQRFPLLPDRSGNWSLRAEFYFDEGELVSIKFFEYANYGGAHPTRGIHGRNYDGSAGGALSLPDIFSQKDAVFEYLKDYCEQDVNRQLLALGEEQTYSLANYVKESFLSRWKIFLQWNFAKDGLSIAFGQFSELPFVMGVFRGLDTLALLYGQNL